MESLINDLSTCGCYKSLLLTAAFQKLFEQMCIIRINMIKRFSNDFMITLINA